MLRLPLLPLALVGLLVTFASVLRAASSEVPYFTDNGYGNPVSSLQHPAGEHHAGVTYVAYQGPHEDPYVAAYVHATASWIGPVHDEEP
jgi:hypothetical protein